MSDKGTDATRPAKGQYRVLVRLGSTPVRRVAMAVSLLTLLGLWPLAWLLVCRQRRPALRDPITTASALGDV